MARTNMRPIRRRTAFVFTIPLWIAPLAGCPAPPGGSQAGKPVSGEIAVVDLRIAPGQVWQFDDDLMIRVEQDVFIDGDLIAIGDRGQSITIRAQGDVFVSGRMIAGHGGGAVLTAKSLTAQPKDGGRDGGDLTIESVNGNVVIMDGARVAAGDGADGVLNEDGITGGAGGNGGNVTFRALNGTIVFPQTPGAIHLGNGGQGADVNANTDKVADADIPAQFENRGGDSGRPILEALRLEGVEIQTRVLDSDLRLSDSNEPIALAGEEINVLPFDDQTGPMDGGRGGNAGSTTVEGSESKDAPPGKQIRFQSRMPNVSLEIIGSDGGDGYFSTGDGGSAFARGLNGDSPGKDGQGVVARGGNGGNCYASLVTFELDFFTLGNVCEPGAGGDAIAFGGNGAPGAVPAGDGGNGGDAEANAGEAGSKTGLFESDPIPCATAAATAGSGAKGGEACDDSGANAGDGGAGGSAIVRNLVLESCRRDDVLRAAGGDGADGGFAPKTRLVGLGGARGFVTKIAFGTGTIRGLPDGEPGQDGGICLDSDDGADPNSPDQGLIPIDRDDDGTPDDQDNCPDDANKTEPGDCGCGSPDTDSDGDGTADCVDDCPNDANKTRPGDCGCGSFDGDSDRDGTPDCLDDCPDDANKIKPGLCGCGAFDLDRDNDGVCDFLDNDVDLLIVTELPEGGPAVGAGVQVSDTVDFQTLLCDGLTDSSGEFRCPEIGVGIDAFVGVFFFDDENQRLLVGTAQVPVEQQPDGGPLVIEIVLQKAP